MFLIPAYEWERQTATARYIIFFFFNNLIGQVLAAGLTMIFYLIAGNDLTYLDVMPTYIAHSGIWVFIMLEMTIYGLKNPDVHSFCCFLPCPIRAIYIPWIFFLIGLIFADPPFDLLSGIVLGYIHEKTKLLRWTVVSDQFTAKCQNWFVFKWIRVFGTYITLANSTGNTVMGET
jgi:hypothetical protein